MTPINDLGYMSHSAIGKIITLTTKTSSIIPAAAAAGDDDDDVVDDGCHGHHYTAGRQQHSAGQCRRQRSTPSQAAVP